MCGKAILQRRGAGPQNRASVPRLSRRMNLFVFNFKISAIVKQQITLTNTPVSASQNGSPTFETVHSTQNELFSYFSTEIKFNIQHTNSIWHNLA